MSSTLPEESNSSFQHNCGWINRFRVACRGVTVAVRAEISFLVHLLATTIVLLAATLLEISRWEWCVVVLCIGVVLSAELLNTSIERIARAISLEEDPHIRDALDIASGAVLVAALGAAIVGLLVFGVHAVEKFSS